LKKPLRSRAACTDPLTRWELRRVELAKADLRRRGVRLELSTINRRLLRIMGYLLEAVPPHLLRRRVNKVEEFHQHFSPVPFTDTDPEPDKSLLSFYRHPMWSVLNSIELKAVIKM